LAVDVICFKSYGCLKDVNLFNLCKWVSLLWNFTDLYVGGSSSGLMDDVTLALLTFFLKIVHRRLSMSSLGKPPYTMHIALSPAVSTSSIEQLGK
jgi:hypothetical protein